jgi:hypothetical protein
MGRQKNPERQRRQSLQSKLEEISCDTGLATGYWPTNLVVLIKCWPPPLVSFSSLVFP